jgi:hypothetical protein
MSSTEVNLAHPGKRHLVKRATVVGESTPLGTRARLPVGASVSTRVFVLDRKPFAPGAV